MRHPGSRGSLDRPPSRGRPLDQGTLQDRDALPGTISYNGFALRCSTTPSWRLRSTTWSRPRTNDWGSAQRSPNYLVNTYIKRCLECQWSRSRSRWRSSDWVPYKNTQNNSQKIGEKKFFASDFVGVGFEIPEVNYVEVFVSIRGVPTFHRAFRAWLTGRWWSLKPGQPLWATAGQPEDPPGAGKNGWKITQMGSVSSGFAPRDHRCPPEGKRWPRGHGRHYNIKGYRVRYPQIPDPSRKSSQSDKYY